jgi:3-hydroxyisobutyrate dehydrogenase
MGVSLDRKGDAMKEKIGFIGLGAMGLPMSKNVIQKGYSVTAYDIASKRLDDIVALGAKPASSSQEVAERSDIVITMVPSSPHSMEAILGECGVIHGMKEGGIVIDMSTIDPVTTKEISEKLLERGINMLDAPVVRGVRGATEGTLAIYVGGESDVFDRCKPLLSTMGTDIEYCGKSGAGEVVKLINNLLVAVSMCSLSEALVLGVKAGVNPEVLYRTLSKGSANSFVLQNHVKNFVMKGVFPEGVFPIDYIMKDLDLVRVTAEKHHVPQYFGSLAFQAYQFARASGYGKQYVPAVIQVLEKLVGVEVRGKTE